MCSRLSGKESLEGLGHVQLTGSLQQAPDRVDQSANAIESLSTEEGSFGSFWNYEFDVIISDGLLRFSFVWWNILSLWSWQSYSERVLSNSYLRPFQTTLAKFCLCRHLFFCIKWGTLQMIPRIRSIALILQSHSERILSLVCHPSQSLEIMQKCNFSHSHTLWFSDGLLLHHHHHGFFPSSLYSPAQINVHTLAVRQGVKHFQWIKHLRLLLKQSLVLYTDFNSVQARLVWWIKIVYLQGKLHKLNIASVITFFRGLDFLAFLVYYKGCLPKTKVVNYSWDVIYPFACFCLLLIYFSAF